MQNLATLEVMHRAVRARICRVCVNRPSNSELWAPDMVRACEGKCPIMQNLGRLAAIANSTAGDRRADYEHTIEEHICQNCHYTQGAGDYCPKRVSRSCPLSVHAADAIELVESIIAHRKAHQHA